MTYVHFFLYNRKYVYNRLDISDGNRLRNVTNIGSVRICITESVETVCLRLRNVTNNGKYIFYIYSIL